MPSQDTLLDALAKTPVSETLEPACPHTNIQAVRTSEFAPSRDPSLTILRNYEVAGAGYLAIKMLPLPGGQTEDPDH